MRGTGRTTGQLLEAVKLAEDGIPVLYVCGSAREVNYTAHLLSMLCEKPINWDTRTMEFGGTPFRLVSIKNRPENALGWRGKIIFDHNAPPNLGCGRRALDEWWEWARNADYINSKLTR